MVCICCGQPNYDIIRKTNMIFSYLMVDNQVRKRRGIMKYKGADKHAGDSEEFIKNFCSVKKEVHEGVSIEIYVGIKDENKQVGIIKGFFRERISGRMIKKYSNRFHIATLGVTSEYQRRGIGTYLMKEIIRCAERQNVKYITVNPVATIEGIKQEDLEKFYKNFTFYYRHLGVQKEREIEFELVGD